MNLLTHDLKSETKLLEHQKNQSPLPITDLRRLRRLTQILICEILLNRDPYSPSQSGQVSASAPIGCIPQTNKFPP